MAYGPEAMVPVLAAAGTAALCLTLPVTLAIAGLLVVLVVSYCQVIADHGGQPVGHRRKRRVLMPPMVVFLAAIFGVIITGLLRSPGGGDRHRAAESRITEASAPAPTSSSGPSPTGSPHDRPGGPSKGPANRWLRELTSLPRTASLSRTASPSVSGSSVVCRARTPNSYSRRWRRRCRGPGRLGRG